MVIDNEPWFVGRDIAVSLGYAKPENAVSSHVDSDDKTTTLIQGTGSNYKSKVVLVNESGLYSLIMGSKLESVKQFKRWVTSEVLPTIRKTGGYINNVDLMINTYFSDLPDDQKTLVTGLLNNITALQNKNKILENKNEALNNENNLLSQNNLKWADRPLINSLVRAYAFSIGGNFGKAWNDFKKELLYKHGINLNSRITNYLNTSGKKTKPKTLDMIDDSELSNAISTIVSMCRENEVEIDELLNNKAETK